MYRIQEYKGPATLILKRVTILHFSETPVFKGNGYSQLMYLFSDSEFQYLKKHAD